MRCLKADSLHSKNLVEKIMCEATLAKIKELKPEKIFSEFAVLLPNGKRGSYDFLIECNGSKIGFELMCRPTKGKLKEKLVYINGVNKYVFVLPAESFELYKKRCASCFESLTRPKYFPKEFANKKLFVWLCSLEEKRIVTQARFSKVFNVEK